MKRVRVATAMTAIMCAGAAAAVAATPSRLPVSPAKGGRRTAFTVRFTAPMPSGSTGVQNVSYEVSASGPPRARRCLDQISANPVATGAGELVSVRLDPRAERARWCVGRFTGNVDEIVSPRCGPPILPAPQAEARRPFIICPLFASVLEPLGTFAFRVR